MNDNILFSRELCVIPGDVLKGISAKELGKTLEEVFGCDMWLLLNETALAFSPRGVLFERSVVVNFENYVDITKPIFDFVGRYTTCNNEQLLLEIPDRRFHVRIDLQCEEIEKRYCRFMKRYLTEYEPFAFIAYASYSLTEKVRFKIRQYLVQRINKYSEMQLYGERLNFGEYTIVDYHRDADALYHVEDGFEIRCERYFPVSWPWIELYLDIRQNLSRTERLSFVFFNAPDQIPRRNE